jgi:hypothetical protein
MIMGLFSFILTEMQTIERHTGRKKKRVQMLMSRC